MCKGLFNRKTTVIIGIIVMVLLGSRCTRDNEEDLFAGELCITENITYAADIAPMMQQHCNVCHSITAPQANVVTSQYASLRAIVIDGRLLGSVKHEAGFVAMPFGLPKLDDCLILRLESWINAGALNN
jgi:hypothetical protein